MYIAGRWADRQLSRLELVIAVIVISLVIYVLMQKMLKIFAAAERGLLTTTVVNINTAMQYRAAWYILQGDQSELEIMQLMNPFVMGQIDSALLKPEKTPGVPSQLLAGIVDVRLPGNYLGEMDRANPDDIEGGRWYFDRQEQKLVYRVDNDEYFYSSLSGPARVEFKVIIDYVDTNGDNRFNPQMDEYRNIRLRAMNDYEWQL
jgi:hypothetical protein